MVSRVDFVIFNFSCRLHNFTRISSAAVRLFTHTVTYTTTKGRLLYLSVFVLRLLESKALTLIGFKEKTVLTKVMVWEISNRCAHIHKRLEKVKISGKRTFLVPICSPSSIDKFFIVLLILSLLLFIYFLIALDLIESCFT